MLFRSRAEPIGSEVILNVFDTLVAWTPPDFAALEGRLATRWTVSPDGRSIEFELRDGVRFHDGTAFDAAAVKFSLERTKGMNPFAQASFNLISEITVVSPRVVRIVAGPGERFSPSTVRVRRGETITFRVTGMGPQVHEFMVGPAADVAADRPGTPEIADIAMMRATSVTVTFDGPGPYAFACHAPGHYEAGMMGTIELVG